MHEYTCTYKEHTVYSLTKLVNIFSFTYEFNLSIFMLKNSELIVTYQCSKFIVNHMLITWLQDFTSGDVVIQVRANDSDSGVNAEIDYSITGVCFW